MKKYLLGGLAAGLMLGGFTLAAAPASATGNPESICDGYLDGTAKIDTTMDPATVTYTAPAGFLVDEYCVKAGSDSSGGGKVIVVVSGPQKTVIIDHPTVNSVSHYSVSFTPACEFNGQIPSNSAECIPAKPPTPDPVVVVTESKCSTGDLSVRVTTTTTKSKYVVQAGAWVKVQDGDPIVVESTRPLNVEEEKACSTTVDAAGPVPSPPTPAAAAAVAPAAVAPGAVAPGAVAPGAVGSGAVAPGAVESAAAVAPAAGVAPAAARTALPATGTSSWSLFFVGLAALLGGLGLLKLSGRNA